MFNMWIITIIKGCSDLKEGVWSFDHNNVVEKLASLWCLHCRGHLGRRPPVAVAVAIFFSVAQTPGRKIIFMVIMVVRLRESRNWHISATFESALCTKCCTHLAAVVGVTTPTTVWLRMTPDLPKPADLLPLPGSETERNRFVMRAQLVVTSCKNVNPNLRITFSLKSSLFSSSSFRILLCHITSLLRPWFGALKKVDCLRAAKRYFWLPIWQERKTRKRPR